MGKTTIEKLKKKSNSILNFKIFKLEIFEKYLVIANCINEDFYN